MKKIKSHLFYSIIVTFFTTIYFSPINFDKSFIFSFGVVAFAIISLIVEPINPFFLGLSVGIFNIAMRTLTDLVVSIPFKVSLLNNAPALAFYVTFGLILNFTLNDTTKYNPKRFFPIIFLAEILSNIVEILVRGDYKLSFFITIIIFAFIRTSIATSIWSIIKYQKTSLTNKSERERYGELNTIISDIYAEMFYLKKSSGDIENVMTKSYNLYSDPDVSENVKQKALEISKDIHEIRKDYYRCIKGFDSLISENNAGEKLSVNSIFEIIKNNIKRVISADNKNIEIVFHCEYDCEVKRFYDFFAILNNLISNAIDACGNEGKIQVNSSYFNDSIILTVKDNGKGIDEDTLPYIFNAGFTTKFNDVTGNASAGIGLCHIKNLTEDLGGQISAENINGQTIFKVTIPIKTIQ
ncbi:MAG: ATP-binding protein [Oscillospiraceae bacterium]